MVLTEWRYNAVGMRIESALASVGYKVWRPISAPDKNSLLIATRNDFSAEDITPAGASKGCIALATFANSFRLVGAYFPQMNAKRIFFERIFEVARSSKFSPLLFIGDLNTGNNVCDLTSGATPFACAHEFNQLSSEHLHDLWRHQWGPEAREFTWISAYRNGTNRFRIDHAFGNDAL